MVYIAADGSVGGNKSLWTRITDFFRGMSKSLCDPCVASIDIFLNSFNVYVFERVGSISSEIFLFISLFFSTITNPKSIQQKSAASRVSDCIQCIGSYDCHGNIHTNFFFLFVFLLNSGIRIKHTHNVTMDVVIIVVVIVVAVGESLVQILKV